MLEPLRPGERTAFEGKSIANRVLLSLGDREFLAIRPSLRFITFDHHDVLHESNRRVDNVYFPDEGLISLVVVMSNGRTAEAGGLAGSRS